MNLKIISDCHFGVGTLTEFVDGKWVLTKTGWALIERLKNADILVLNGDIFEGSTLHPYQSMDASQPFFDALREHTNIKVIIFVGGNHDDFIMSDLRKGLSRYNNPRRAQKHYVPCRVDKGIIDLPDCNNTNSKSIPSLLEQRIILNGNYNDGNLHGITGIDYNITCSDLIINGKILVMHGHQEDPAYGGLAYDLLYILTGRKEFDDIQEFYEYLNIPLTISGEALGNAGRATKETRSFQESWNAPDQTKLYNMTFILDKSVSDNALERFFDLLDEKTKGNITQEAIEKITFKWLLSRLNKFRGKQARGDKEFPDQTQLSRYHELIGFSPTNSYTTIVGHSHIPYNDYNFDNKLYNTGGYMPGNEAQVISIDTETNEVTTR